MLSETRFTILQKDTGTPSYTLGCNKNAVVGYPGGILLGGIIESTI